MANTLIQFRADETERSQAIQILDELGMDLPSYLRMSMSRLVTERGIPFPMSLEERDVSKGILALKWASLITQGHGIEDMSLEEINQEIAAARVEESSRA